MESLFLDERRNPACCLVELNKSWLNVSDFDEPAVETSIDERGLTTPAERITMSDCSAAEKFACSLQVSDNSLVSILDVLTLIGLDFGSELSILINGHGSLAWLDDSSSYTSCVIVFTKAGCAMNDTGTSTCSNP